MSFTALVTADFHYSLRKQANTIIPMMSYCDGVLQALFHQVIRIKPDAFIILGDMTNSGNRQDMQALANRLEPIQRNNIPIIMIPGNHDFNHCDKETYLAMYHPLLPNAQYDQHTCSYAIAFDKIKLFAMDDSSYAKDTRGIFPEQTMFWLREQLEQAKQNNETPIFLSHHNVLPDDWMPHPEHYKIQNKDLLHLLNEYKVHLCLSAHQHYPSIRTNHSIHEIIVPMPLMANQSFSILTIANNTIHYQLLPIAMSQRLMMIAKQNNQQTLENLLQAFKIDNQETLQLLRRFYISYANGLGQKEKESIRTDPLYPQLIKSLAKSFYGEWIDYLINHSLDSHQLCLKLP